MTIGKDINCPVRGHTHAIKLEQDPDRSDMVVGRCGDRIVYRSSAREHLADEAGDLYSLTVTELKRLPEWNAVQTPRPTKKDEIVEAILKLRTSRDSQAGPFNYFVPSYKE